MPALGNWWKKFTRESISGQKPLFWIPEGKNKYKIHYTVEWFITISIAVLAEIIIRAFPARQHYFYLQDPDISYPILPELVTGSFLFIYSVAMPLLVILFISIAVVTSVHDMHHGILGLLQSCAVSYLVTNSIKLYLGGMRPCFLEICDPDPNMLETAPKYGYNGLFYDTSVCMGDQSDVKDAQFGFASGHACIAAAGMTFLSLYLHAKCKTFNERGSLWTYLLVLLSSFGAILVGFSRVVDKHHTGYQVLMGTTFGILIAASIYKINYLSLFGVDNHIPVAEHWYFRNYEPLNDEGDGNSSLPIIHNKGNV